MIFRDSNADIFIILDCCYASCGVETRYRQHLETNQIYADILAASGVYSRARVEASLTSRLVELLGNSGLKLWTKESLTYFLDMLLLVQEKGKGCLFGQGDFPSNGVELGKLYHYTYPVSIHRVAVPDDSTSQDSDVEEDQEVKHQPSDLYPFTEGTGSGYTSVDGFELFNQQFRRQWTTLLHVGKPEKSSYKVALLATGIDMKAPALMKLMRGGIYSESARLEGFEDFSEDSQADPYDDFSANCAQIIMRLCPSTVDLYVAKITPRMGRGAEPAYVERVRWPFAPTYLRDAHPNEHEVLTWRVGYQLGNGSCWSGHDRHALGFSQSRGRIISANQQGTGQQHYLYRRPRNPYGQHARLLPRKSAWRDRSILGGRPRQPLAVQPITRVRTSELRLPR